jgi:hypothetical protein
LCLAYDPLNVIRSQFYVELAKLCGVPFVPHPWREKLLSFSLTKKAPIAIDVAHHISAALAEFRKEISQTISIVETTSAPPIAATILRRAKTPRYVAEVAMDIRKKFARTDFPQLVWAESTTNGKLWGLRTSNEPEDSQVRTRPDTCQDEQSCMIRAFFSNEREIR